MRAAFASAAFRRLFTANAVSMLGDSILLLVLSMWVKELTGSNARAGLTFFWMMLPALFAPLYGVLIDRVRRRPLLVRGNLLSALAVLPLLLVREAGDVWIIYAVAFLYGISAVVLPAGLNGFLKEMLPDEHLVDANAGLQTVREGLRLFGPLVGAGLFGWLGGGTVAVVDAVSFLFAAVVIATIRIDEARPERTEQHLFDEMAAGIRHLARDAVLRHVLVAVGIMLLVIGYFEASIYALLDFYHRPATFAGVLVTVQGVGAVAGGLTTSHWVRRIGEVGTLAFGLVLLAGSAGLIAAGGSLVAVFAGMVLCGYSLPLLFISFTTLLQRRTPHQLMGRASAAVETLLGVPQALSLVVGAALVSVLDFRIIIGVVAVVTLAGAGYLLGVFRSRLWRRQPAVPTAAAAG